MIRSHPAIAVWGSAAALSLTLGPLLVAKAELAFLIVTVVVLIGVLATAKCMAITGLTTAACILVSAVIDTPGHISAGRVSAYAVLTIVLTILLVFVSFTSSALGTATRLQSVLFPFFGLAVWAVISAIWSHPSVDGMQNILLYISFPTLILVSATSARTGAISPPNFARLVDVTFLIGALFYLMSLLTSGIGGSAVAGPRSYALFGMLGVAWGAARYRHGFREGMLVGTVSLTMVFLSLSRLAALSAVLIAVLALVDFRRFARSLAVTALIAAVAFFAVTHTSFSSRFSKGDVRSVAGFEINVSGRAQLWSLTWNSYESSPLIGHGVGSAETLVKQKYPGDDHPHNDYLRLLHDLGAIGLFMFLVGYLSLFARLFRARSAARTSPTIAYLLRASALSLGAVLLAMITDNPLVYLFVIAPVASVVGYSLGALLALQDEEAVFQRPVRL